MSVSLSKDQWLERLKTWVPEWFTSSSDKNEAILSAMALILSQAGEEVDRIVAETFLDTATTPFLNLMGHERSVYILPGESLSSFRVRIKTSSTTSKVGIEDIRNLVKNLIPKESIHWVRDDWESCSFLNRSNFTNRRDLTIDLLSHGFTVFVDNEFDNELLTVVIKAINDTKAFGVLYRFVERV